MRRWGPSGIYPLDYSSSRPYDEEDMLTRKLMVCRPCHNVIHRCVPDEKELAAVYATREDLLANECIVKQVAYLARQRVRD